VSIHLPTFVGRLVPLGLCALGLGCGASAQSNAIEQAMRNDKERDTAFEATARMLDRHPEWVDEFYRVARRHPTMMLRILRDTAHDLDQPRLAGATAEMLAQKPSSLEQTVVSTMDRAAIEPESRRAVDRAILRRNDEIIGMMADDEAVVAASVTATVAEVERRPAARAAFLRAMRESADRVAEILASDPKTLRAVSTAVLKREVSHREDLEVLLKDAGFLPK
jgi:hypothetical protein